MTRRKTPALLLAATLSLLPASLSHAADAPKRPNILLLLADDLGWTDTSVASTSLNNGNTYAQTPNLQRLAKQGLSFTQMRACPNCAPTRAALMTGEYPVHNGVYNVGSLDRGEGDLDPAKQRSQHITHEAVTFAETLRAAGYSTCHVGKYHVSMHPDVTAYDGFDFNYGGGWKGDGGSKGYFARKDSGQPETPASPRNGASPDNKAPVVQTGWTFTNLGPEMNAFATPYTKEYVEKNLKPFANGNDPSAIVGTPKHLTDADIDAAIDFLDKHAAGPDKDKPFFINVAFNAVHTVVKARPDLDAKYNKIKSNDPRHNRADFAGLTEGVDQAVGRILKYLDDHHLADNTLVIFTSDNGGSSASTHNDPLRGYKGMFYDGGLRVPLIARFPGIKPDSTTDAMAFVADLYPTFADYAQAKLPDPSVHPLDGHSLRPLLQGDASAASNPPRTALYYHFPGYLDTRAFPSSTIIKQLDDKKTYKLFYSYEDQHYELFNLTDDLSEKDDLLKDGKPSEAAKSTAENLRSDLVHHLESNHPLMASDKKTHEPTPLPIPLDDALRAGNKITKSPNTKGKIRPGSDD